MASTIQEVWNLELVKSFEEENARCQHAHRKSQDTSYELLGNRDSKVDPAYPRIKCKLTTKSMWIRSWSNPSLGDGELRRRRGLSVSTQAQGGALCQKHKKVIHGEALLHKHEGTAFVALLRACAKNKDLHRGIRLHDDILKSGLLTQCSDALVTMYAKCGALTKAKELLDMHKSRNVFSWTALIAGYARHGQSHDALNCFKRMRHEGLSPDAVTFACILKACGSLKAAGEGEQIHDEIAREGLLVKSIVLGNALVDMYVKCGALTKAQRVLEELPSRDAVSWNALIAGYAQQGEGEQALNCFEQMQHEGLSPDAVTFTCILKACGTLGAFDKGEQIHDEIGRRGLLGRDIVLGTALMDMYVKCGALAKAQQVLEELPFRDVVSWSALIAGYADQGLGEQALTCFERMQREGLSPDAVTFTCILKACGSIGAADKGKQIHDEIVRKGLLKNNVVLGTAVVDMYAKCGALVKARQLLEELPFRDVVSWNALIAGYTQQGQGVQALDCFKRMLHEGLSPDAATFACILKACGTIGAVDKGEQIHDDIARQGLLGKNIVLGTALVDMYAKCGALVKAQRVLEELFSQDVDPWNALIAGYAQHGQCEQALKCFERMQGEGLAPDAVTYSGVLKACSHLGLVEDAHMYFVSMTTKYGIKPDLEHYTCIIDLFGRAGHLGKAVRVVQEMSSYDDSAVWSALLGACQNWGDVNYARWAFKRAVQVDESDAAAYVVMANIYAAAGLREDDENIEDLEKKAYI